MTDLLDDLVRARIPWVSPTVRSWYDDAALVRQLADGQVGS